MRATMGSRGVPVMYRHLHFVLGTTLMYDHATVFFWRRLKAFVRSGESSVQVRALQVEDAVQPSVPSRGLAIRRPQTVVRRCMSCQHTLPDSPFPAGCVRAIEAVQERGAGTRL